MTDNELITSRTYALPSSEAMKIRRATHRAYTVPSHDFTAWVLKHFAWRGDERVLDVGSGPGNYFESMMMHISPDQYTGIDLEFSVLKDARKGGAINVAAGDAVSLPFPDNSLDIILANHMLYQVDDIERALLEFRRVLKPTGILLAGTNSHYTMPELNTLVQRTFRLLGLPFDSQENPVFLSLNRFSLETGTVQLARHFPAVARFDLPGTLIFHEAKPVVDYIDSNQNLYLPGLPDDVEWDDFLMLLRDQVRRLISHFGEISVNKLTGVLVATEQGGFAEEYLRLLSESSKNGG